MTWSNGDTSLSQTLTDNDHLYPAHINELRVAVDTLKSLVYNVKDYGATGDGTTDDTDAIDDALTAIASSTSKAGILYFPAGVYRRTTVIALVATTSNVNIIGQGMNISEIKFDADVNGITVDNSSTSNKHFLIQDISISTTQASTDKIALSLTGRDSQESNFSVERVNFRGNGTAPVTTYWSTGILLTNGFYTDVRNCWFEGLSTDRTKSLYGIRLAGTSTNVRLIGNSYYFLNKGVYNVDDGTSEGVVISDSHFVQCTRGVEWQSDGNMLTCIGNHVEVSEYGIFISTGGTTYGRFSTITNNFILLTGTLTTKVGIQIDGNYNIVSNNQILAAAETTNNIFGIVLEDDADFCVVSGNIVIGCDNVGILVQSGATSNKVIGNTGTSNGTDYTDSGTSTTTSGNF